MYIDASPIKFSFEIGVLLRSTTLSAFSLGLVYLHID